MSEMIKTLLFLGVASALAIGAVVSRPQTAGRSLDERVGQPLFEEFTDPLQAASMEITRFDPATLEVIPFEVANTSKGWVIRSKEGYPADATDQMAQAANNLIGLQILGIPSTSSQQHAEFGVLEPNQDRITASDTGVGKMVVIRDNKKKVLANLIIGVQDQTKEDLCYVRIPGQDPVYQVKLDPEVFTTDFTAWIDRDLLKINPFDVTSFRIRDYEARVTPQSTVVATPRMDAIVGYDEELNQWSLLNLQEAETGGRLEDSGLTSGEKLNASRLDDLRNALDQLTITGVFAKPANLASALKSAEGLRSLQATDLPSLDKTGFLPGVPPGSDAPALMGSRGELIIQTRDAIRYRLLFGARDEGADGEDSRYLFVQAELVTGMIPEPQLQEVPMVEEGDDVDLESQVQARDAAVKANQRAEDQYRQRLNAAKRKVLELNTRFADWYYLISEEQYQKIAIKRDQLAMAADAAPATGAGANGPTVPGFDGIRGLPGFEGPLNRQPLPSVDPQSADESEPMPAEEPAEDQPAEEETDQPAIPEPETPSESPSEPETDEPAEQPEAESETPETEEEPAIDEDSSEEPAESDED